MPNLALSVRSFALAIAATVAGGCVEHASPPLVGAWRSEVRFESGPFATLSDMQFLYVFNAGGTLTESSNYDAVPPVAPAYGTWRQVGPREFVASYEFFTTKPPAKVEELASGAGWMPDGRGRFEERIRVADDGASFDSTFTYTPLTADGVVMAEGSAAGSAHAVRIAATGG